MLLLYSHTHVPPTSPSPESLVTTNLFSISIILSLQECYMGQLDIHMQKNEPQPLPHTIYKN